jgi:3-hydroxybutyryl-CoA dehydrogenase
MVAEGRSGLRTGRGFYDWQGRDVTAEQQAVQRRILGLLRDGDRLPRFGALSR